MSDQASHRGGRPAAGRTKAVAGWVEPELALLTRERFFSPDWMYERKLDGERCLTYRDGGEVTLLTRNRLDVSRTYPEVREALARQDASDFVVDGEIVAFAGSATSFSRLQQRLGVADPSPRLLREVPVVYFVFDVMRAAGKDVRPLPLRDRKRVLKDLLSFGGPLRYTAHRSRDGAAYLEHACASGWEGLIAKRADAPYQSGRGRDWLKFKCENGQEFVIGGYTDPKGSRAGFGALLIGYYENGDLVYAGKVGTGFDDATLARLEATMRALAQPGSPFTAGTTPRSGVHWVAPRLVCQVGFTEWTTAGQLRHPRYLGLRDDKDPAEVRRERPAG
jgi:DNA ligase D-like protein (predicted ligase)